MAKRFEVLPVYHPAMVLGGGLWSITMTRRRQDWGLPKSHETPVSGPSSSAVIKGRCCAPIIKLPGGSKNQYKVKLTVSSLEMSPYHLLKGI